MMRPAKRSDKARRSSGSGFRRPAVEREQRWRFQNYALPRSFLKEDRLAFSSAV